jgi:L-rhamnonate dehydratase
MMNDPGRQGSWPGKSSQGRETMKITQVEALILRQPEVQTEIADGSQDALIVRIYTDEGIVGIGEVDSSPFVAKSVIDAPASHKVSSGLRSVLVGQDPFQIEYLWDLMYQSSIYYGRRGAAVHAMSGLDIALWDILGQATGQPIYRLLGGAHRDRVKAYASTLMPETPEEVRAVVSRWVEAGFRAVKLGWGPLGSDPDRDVALVAAAREVAGDAIDLMIDVGLGWSDVPTAIRTAKRMEEYRPYWIEEPFMPDALASYARLADALETRVAAGEQEATHWAFRTLIEQGKVDVIQPDVTRAGGLTECRRIAVLAQDYGVTLVPHAWSTGIIKAASLHLVATLSAAPYFEYCVQDSALNRKLVSEQFPLQDGFVAIPQAPGLGVKLDERYVREFVVDSSI